MFGKSSAVLGKIVGLAIRLFGWNMSSVESSKALAVPEIIMQTSSEVEMDMAGHVVYDDNLSSSAIINDGVIGADASLAKALLDDPDCPKAHKVFLGIAEHHNEGIWNPGALAEKIEEGLRV